MLASLIERERVKGSRTTPSIIEEPASNSNVTSISHPQLHEAPIQRKLRLVAEKHPTIIIVSGEPSPQFNTPPGAAIRQGFPPQGTLCPYTLVSTPGLINVGTSWQGIYNSHTRFAALKSQFAHDAVQSAFDVSSHIILSVVPGTAPFQVVPLTSGFIATIRKQQAITAKEAEQLALSALERAERRRAQSVIDEAAFLEDLLADVPVDGDK
jgi:hypothetical protein